MNPPACSLFVQPPALELPARLKWSKRYGEIIFHPDSPWAVLSLTPDFPFCSPLLAERGIVWDLDALLGSVRRPGAGDILNCGCGIPDDADLEAPVLVSHPDAGTVVWELDIPGLRPALNDSVGETGFLRLVFGRMEYETDVRGLLKDVQAAARSRVPVEMLKDSYGYDAFLKAYPHLRELPVDELEPPFGNTDDIEKVLTVDADAPRPREPMFPAGTRIEIGPFGDHDWRIDGKAPRLRWIGREFTRWETWAAYRRWRYAFDQGPEAVREAGLAFADALRRGFMEGETAPGVEVQYACANPLAG